MSVRPYILYANQAYQSSQAVEEVEVNLFLRWREAGRAAWRVPIDAEGDYEVAICYKNADPGGRLTIRHGDQAVTAITEATGWWYTRAVMPGVVHLTAGEQELSLELAEPVGRAFALRAVELRRLADAPAQEAEQARALAARASTDGFAGRYGLMFHWTDLSAPRHGKRLPYAEAVARFDVEAFADMVAETGAAYVIFTACHAVPHFPAPLAAWEARHPGHAAARDLIAEMATALRARGVQLFLYLSSHILAPTGQVDDATFAAWHNELLAAVGERYGALVSGYWLDGWGHIYASHPTLDFADAFAACKVGNPARLVAFNFWQFPTCTDWGEYWAGEMVLPDFGMTKERVISHGVARGLQYHALLMLDAPWMHHALDTPMEPLKFSADDLCRFVADTTRAGGAVTLNLGIYQDGGIGEAARAALQQLRAHLTR